MLGSNVGNRLLNLKKASYYISKKAIIIKKSPVYETKAWGYTNQPSFLNACLLINTTLTPYKLLRYIKHIEQKVGRKKRFKWGPREIDIDIILWGNKVLSYNNLLKIPHPYLHKRSFVLIPLTDIFKNWVHPLLKKTPIQLLKSIKKEELTEITTYKKRW